MYAKHYAALMIGFVGIVYTGILITKVLRKDWPMAAVWFGYSLSNFGFMISELKS